MTLIGRNKQLERTYKVQYLQGDHWCTYYDTKWSESAINVRRELKERYPRKQTRIIENVKLTIEIQKEL